MCGATTGISDEDAHRFSRASRISLVLSDCEEARKRLSHTLERRRVSARLRVLARCSASWISPCSDRPCALAADFRRDNTWSSRSRIKTFAMIAPMATISHRYHSIHRKLPQVRWNETAGLAERVSCPHALDTVQRKPALGKRVTELR